MRITNRFAPFLLLLLAFLASSGSAQTLSACYNTTNGVLRLVGSAADCREGEGFVQWNIVGPQGPQGPQGPEGAPGVNDILTPTTGKQRSWASSTQTESTFPPVYTALRDSALTATTTGGDLLVFMTLTIGGPGHIATCRPVIDGIWAGAYGNLPASPASPWEEGFAYSEEPWMRWTLTRVYPGIPPGKHDFHIECSGGVWVCQPHIPCSWGFVELH